METATTRPPTLSLGVALLSAGVLLLLWIDFVAARSNAYHSATHLKTIVRNGGPSLGSVPLATHTSVAIRNVGATILPQLAAALLVAGLSLVAALWLRRRRSRAAA
jgi:hypothetical protein